MPLRILDLGSHDGYISCHIARELDAHVDGVELNPDAVRLSTERAARYGCAGEFKVGLAEDAPNLFEPGTYDAVVAFELIEHVPEVDRLLDVCERMLKPGGRVYLSTPDGTFGAGQNPHHLRVLRSVDMADLCRRRGTLEAMISGDDGIGVVCYEPWLSKEPRRGELAIYCGAGWEQWSPLDIENKGLGGSETWAVRTAEALQRLGWIVTVYGEVLPGAYGQVVYRHHSVFDPLEARDAVLVSRSPHLFERPINATLKVLWMHDTDYGPGLSEKSAVNADAVVVLSGWHRAHVLQTYPFIDEKKLVLAPNGIDPSYFAIPSFGENATPEADGKPVEWAGRNPHRAIYSSSPDRGLDFLLELWPQVRERVPDAELVYCYSAVYDSVADQQPQLAAFRDRVRTLADQPGVSNLGSLPQPTLAKVMMECGAWLNPGWNSIHGLRFFETYCIGAVEAAAAGCHLVMSKWGALVERADEANSWFFPATLTDSPTHPPSAEAWVDSIVDALQADEPGQSDIALGCTWERVAAIVQELYDVQSSLVAQEKAIAEHQVFGRWGLPGSIAALPVATITQYRGNPARREA